MKKDNNSHGSRSCDCCLAAGAEGCLDQGCPDCAAYRSGIRKVMAFISRHEPTAEQRTLAAQAGYLLEHVGDIDAFKGDIEGVTKGGYTAAAVVHPYLALRIAGWMPVGVFRNVQRPLADGRPTFLCDGLFIMNIYPDPMDAVLTAEVQEVVLPA